MLNSDHTSSPQLSSWQQLGLVGLAMTAALMLLVADARWIPQPQYIFAGFGFGALFIARDIARGHSLRPVGAVIFAAIGLLALAVAATGRHGLALLLSSAACAALLAAEAPPCPGTREQRRYVWSLVNRTVADTLAPFALRTDKSYVFSADGRAAVAYRVRWGTAVASGDPVGDVDAHEAAIDAFCRHARTQGWRIAALGFSPRVDAIWRARGLWSLSIGRDVVIDITRFAMQGRAFRNLRQSVQHTHNCGVTTEILKESEIGRDLRQELENLMRQTPQGLTPRGFVMILDRPLRGEHPGCYIAIARDRTGRAVACQRYASADQGRELTLDLPWRLDDAPNGVDERLIIDTIHWARARDGQRMSLSFAPFPDLFAIRERKPAQQLAYWAAHRLDRFIQLESLYLFLRKFHAFGEHRYVALRPRDLIPAAGAILSLEFSAPRRDDGQRR